MMVFLLTAAAIPFDQAPLKELAALLKAGDWKAAAPVVRELDEAVAQRAPLEVFDGQALVEPAAGLGIYRPLTDGVVKSQELFLYAQVRNHQLKRVKEEWELHLVSDLIILDEKGVELARDEGFGESRFSARAPHRETFVNIALRVTGLPPGRYRARLVVSDRVGNKRGQEEIPFRMP